MNGEAIVIAPFHGKEKTAQHIRTDARPGDTAHGSDGHGLTFSDPALDEFASAMTLRPLLLAYWLFIAVYKATSMFARRVLEIEENQ